jgi:glycosyltransferase involved in cell wall biosynthesis
LAESAAELELSVVMPCLNEERTVGVCVRKAVETMRREAIVGEVVIVDNGSTDRSVEIARAEGARVVAEARKGYGNALRRGFEEARGRYIVMADCDDSYDLTDLRRFVDRLRGGAELVMGNRLRGTIRPGAMKWLHRWVGNPVLSGFLNLLFRTGVGDCHCGMRGFTKASVARMNLGMPGMELASEMVIKSARAGLRIEEFPITLSPDGRDRPPHLRSFRDGWRHLRFMLMCSPYALFALPGLVLTVVGIAAIPIALAAGYGVFTARFGPNFMITAAMIAVVGFQLVVFGLLGKIYAHEIDPVFRDPAIERFLERFSVDRGILWGLALALVGLAVGTPTLWRWIDAGEVPSPGEWILALTLGLIGIETVFSSLLVGVLELPRQSRRQG